MTKFRNIGIALVAIVATVALAADGYKLRRTPKVGEETHMKITADVEVLGMSATFSAKAHEKVIKVDENGNYTVESSQTEGKVKLGADEMDAPDGGKTTTKYSASGAVLEMTGPDITDDALRLAAMNAWEFGEKSYIKGDVIEYDTKPSKTNGNVGSKTKITVGDTEKIGSWDCVKVVYAFKEATGDTPAESTGTAWISTTDGSLVKLEGEYKNAPFPGAPGPINAKMKLERL